MVWLVLAIVTEVAIVVVAIRRDLVQPGAITELAGWLQRSAAADT